MTTENDATPDVVASAPRSTQVTQESTDRLLAKWADTLVNELAIQGLTVDVEAVLSLAGVAAHSVVRPAAPLTTFLVGYAAGVAAASGSASPDEAAADATIAARRIIRAHATEPES